MQALVSLALSKEDRELALRETEKRHAHAHGELFATVQSWRGDERLDSWQEHFLASLASRMYAAGREFDLSADQVDKLEEIREIIEGPPEGTEAWEHAQRAAKRRIAAGAPLASNLWWERRERFERHEGPGE